MSILEVKGPHKKLAQKDGLSYAMSPVTMAEVVPRYRRMGLNYKGTGPPGNHGYASVAA